MRRPAAAALLALAVTASVLGACTTSDPSGPTAAPEASGTSDAPTTTSTVAPEPSPPRAEAPGALVRATPVDAPAGARAWRLVFHSRATDGRDIAVTGLLLSAEAPAADRPIVSYGHPTTGTADTCTPSTAGVPALPWPETMVARGWAVVMSDYEGLGTTDPHPYMAGRSAGQTMLDAVRATRSVPEAGVSAASPVALLGFSQGGHAAAFAAELAPTYAPELAVRGVGLAAPVSDVTSFTARAERLQDQLGVLATLVHGYAAAYPELDPATVLTEEGMGLLAELERRCIGEVNEVFDRPKAQLVRAEATASAPFAARFAENLAGQVRVGVPVLVVQGARDDIVDPADTARLVDRWCALGTPVEEVVLADRNHGALLEQPFVDWLAARLAGQPAGPPCSSSG